MGESVFSRSKSVLGWIPWSNHCCDVTGKHGVSFNIQFMSLERHQIIYRALPFPVETFCFHLLNSRIFAHLINDRVNPQSI